MSLAIDDDIGTRLSMAYRVGLARRRSIQIPCASTGLIASIVGIYIWRRIFPFQHAGVAMVYLGNFVLTLAILPTDALSIRVGLAWSICITLIVGAFHILDVIAANEALATATQGRHDEEPFAHWESVSLFYLRFHLVRDCLYVLAWLHAAPRGLLLGCAADLTPRQRLDGIWRINGHVMLLVAVIAAMFFPIALLDGSVAERGTVYYCFYAIALAVTSLVSGFSLQPGMRARIHSHLSLHSAEMQTAAGIASLLGRHTAREISREARARFTCVTLDAVTYVHMLSPKPDQTFGIQPVHAALGDVDVFLSHSCARRPARASPQPRLDTRDAAHVPRVAASRRAAAPAVDRSPRAPRRAQLARRAEPKVGAAAGVEARLCGAARARAARVAGQVQHRQHSCRG